MSAPGFPAIDRQQLEKQLGYLAELEAADHEVVAATMHSKTVLVSPSESHLLNLIQQYGAAGVFADGAAGAARVVAVAYIVRRLLATETGSKGGFDSLAHMLRTVLAADAAATDEHAANDAVVYWAAYFSDADSAGVGDRAAYSEVGAVGLARYAQWAGVLPTRRHFKTLDALRAAAPPL
jgi:hypothetical protein